MSIEFCEKRLALTEEVASICADIRKYTEGCRSSGKDPDPDRLIGFLRKRNLLCPVIPAQYGGRGLDYTSTSVLVEELAMEYPALAWVISTNVHVVLPLMLCGTEQKKAELLPEFAGDTACIGSFACTEKAGGSDVSSIQSTLLPENGHYILKGQKDFVLNAAVAKYMTVFAYNSPARKKPLLRCAVIPASTPGVRLSRARRVDASLLYDPMEVLFERAELDPSCILDDEDYSGYLTLGQTMDIGRMLTAACALGIARSAYKLAYEYASNRIANGVPIINNQAISFALVDMAMGIEKNKLLLVKACKQMDRKEDYAMSSTMAKLSAGRLAIDVTGKASEIFGARAFIEDSKINELFKFARTMSVVDGTDNILKGTIALMLNGEDSF